MTLYGDTFSSDWDTLTLDEATERAYAIGVAERLGEHNRAELRRIYDDQDAAYERNMIELAYVEGRREADAARVSSGGGDVWAELVEEPDVSVDPDDLATGGRQGLPESLEAASFLSEEKGDSRDALRRPGFLDR